MSIYWAYSGIVMAIGILVGSKSQQRLSEKELIAFLRPLTDDLNDLTKKTQDLVVKK